MVIKHAPGPVTPKKLAPLSLVSNSHGIQAPTQVFQPAGEGKEGGKVHF